MDRRDFLRRLGGAAAAVTLSPLLDLAPILPAPSAALVPEPFVAWVTLRWNLIVDNPAYCARWTNLD